MKRLSQWRQIASKLYGMWQLSSHLSGNLYDMLQQIATVWHASTLRHVATTAMAAKQLVQLAATKGNKRQLDSIQQQIATIQRASTFWHVATTVVATKLVHHAAMKRNFVT